MQEIATKQLFIDFSCDTIARSQMNELEKELKDEKSYVSTQPSFEQAAEQPNHDMVSLQACFM